MLMRMNKQTNKLELKRMPGPEPARTRTATQDDKDGFQADG